MTHSWTGIGLMIAQALEANGAIVFILGRRQEVLDKAASTAVSHPAQRNTSVPYSDTS